MNSSYVVAPNEPMRIYPVPGLIIYQASSVFTGILSRVTTNVSRSPMPRRIIVSLTFVPLGPRSRFIMSSFDIFTPAIAVSFTATMRSPACIPTFSEGPFVIVWMTIRVSSCILNCIPIPSKLPFNDSFMALVSRAVVYDEWGSSFSSMPLMPFSTRLSSLTVST